MKSIKVTFSNGETYKIPLKIIAKSMAEYSVAQYIKNREIKESDKDKVIEEETISALKNPEACLDWIENNTNWKDVKDYAIIQECLEYDYDANFHDAEMELDN